MSEYLSEEEQIAKMKSWWDDNGTFLVGTIVIAILAIGGWRYYDGYRVDQSHEASREYAAYLAADEAGKRAAFDEIAQNFNGSAYHVFGLFDQAQAALSAGDMPRAEALLTEVVDQSSDDLLVDLAKIRLAKVQQGLDRSAQALATLASIRHEGYRSWGLEAKGDIHVARGELELAHAAYEAAQASLQEGDQRPVLAMKLNNVAPFEGQYVPFADTLEEVLQKAQETLKQAEEASDDD